MRRFFLTLIFSLTAATLTAQVRTWVSSNGLDSNDCSRTAPCRNFEAAITAVNTAGEVVALDSAGYGPVNITKSVTVVAPAGVHAAIAPTTAEAVRISAAEVVIRGLYLNSQGASQGFDITGAATNVHIENCVIHGFTSHGLFMESTGSLSRLYVVDSTFRSNVNGINNAVGVMIQGVSVVNVATLEHCRFDGNNHGVLASNNGRITVRDSISSGGSRGFWAHATTQLQPAEMEVVSSVATHHTFDAFATTGASTLTTMTITNSAAFHANAGIASRAGTIRVGGTTVSRNVTGLDADNGTIVSFGNNQVDGNTTNGAPTSTVGTIRAGADESACSNGGMPLALIGRAQQHGRSRRNHGTQAD